MPGIARWVNYRETRYESDATVRRVLEPCLRDKLLPLTVPPASRSGSTLPAVESSQPRQRGLCSRRGTLAK